MGEIIVIKRKIIRESAKKKSLPDLEYDRIMWAIKGRSLEQSRKTLYCIKIEPKKIIATDGSVLFISETEAEYPSGCYDVLISTWKLTVLEKVDVEYPDYAKVLTFTQPPDKVEEFSTEGKDAINLFIYEAYQLQAYALPLLQRAYIPSQSIKMEWREGLLPLVITAPMQTALVMPLKM